MPRCPLNIRKDPMSENSLPDTAILSYRPPYRWEAMLAFLSARAIPGVEAVADGEYRRTARLAGPGGGFMRGWLRVGQSQQADALILRVSGSLVPALPEVSEKIGRLFDLHCEPHVVYQALAAMDEIRPGSNAPGTRLPGGFDPFEMAVRAVLGQQITVKAARTLAGRLVRACGAPIDTGIEGLTHTFPSPGDLLAPEEPIEQRLGPLGIMSARARTIRSLAEALSSGHIDFEHSPDPQGEVKKLLRIPGIGPWTAQYIAMRAMSLPDAFLETDAGVKRAMPGLSPKEILAIAEAWRPWRSYAVINLWNSL